MDGFDRGTWKPPPVPILTEEEVQTRRAKAAEADSRRAKDLAEKAGFGDYDADLMRQARGVNP